MSLFAVIAAYWLGCLVGSAVGFQLGRAWAPERRRKDPYPPQGQRR